MKRLVLTLQFLCFLLYALAQIPADGEAIRNIQWTTKTIAPGIVLKTCERVSFFNSLQSIALIEVDTLTAQVDFKIDYNSAEYYPVSVFGRRNDAIAAINGTYFMTTGTSVGQPWHFMKIEGYRVASTVPSEFDTRATGVFTITDGIADISGWSREKEAANAGDAHYALVCGPLMIDNGVDMDMWDNELVTARHPRSCVANTNDGKVLIIAVDGRQSGRAAGMTLYELRFFVRQLGCVDALNLDGGGSTALYVAGENRGKFGIVNIPIDESIPGEERNVGNILYITSKDGSKPYCVTGTSPGGVGGPGGGIDIPGGGARSIRMWIKANGKVEKNAAGQLIAPYIFDHTGFNDFDHKKRTQEAQVMWNDDKINSYPALAFDSASVLASIRRTDYSTFYSVNTINRNGTLLGFNEYGSHHPRHRYFLMANNDNVYVHDGSNTTGGLNYVFIPYEDNFNRDFNLFSSSYGKKYDTFILNGKEQLNSQSNFCTRDYITAFLQIGARNSYPVTINPEIIDEYFYRGEVAEIIAYSDTLTSSEHIRVESYFAVKYGITMDNPEYRYTPSYGTPRWWDGLSSAYKPYSYYITFIGRDDNSGLHQLRAKSVGNHLLPKNGCILSLIHGNDNIIDDQYFVCAGSTTDDLSLETEFNIGNKTYRVMRRNWKFNTSESQSQPLSVEIDIPCVVNFEGKDIGVIISNGNTHVYHKSVLNAEKNKVLIDNVTVQRGTLMYLALEEIGGSGLEKTSSDFIKVFYNNRDNTITVNGLQDKFYNLYVYSVSGNLLHKSKNHGDMMQASTTGFEKGVYFVFLENENKQIVKREKVIITH